MTIIILCSLFAIVLILTLIDKMKTSTPLKAEKTADTLEKTLQKMNCKYNKDTSKKNVVYFDLTYQGGNFLALCQKNKDQIVNFLFPEVMSVKQENANLIKVICNTMNSQNILIRSVYRYDESKNVTAVDILFDILVDNQNKHIQSYLEKILGFCFTVRNEMEIQFCKIKDECANFEECAENDKRKQYLINEQELLMQSSAKFKDESHYDPEKSITLSQFMTLALQQTPMKFFNLQIVTDTITTLTDSQAIANFDLLHPLRNPNLDWNAPSTQATLIAKYQNVKNSLVQTLCLHLSPEGESQFSRYVRVHSFASALKTNDEYQINNLRTRGIDASVLLAIDNTTDEQRWQEVDFMFQDAVNKIENGKMDELTEEQAMMYRFADNSLKKNLYFGTQLFLDKRYLEALQFFKNSYRELSTHYQQLNNEQQEAFFDINYMMGFIYCDLKQFDRAFYYLDLCYHAGHLQGTQEYINCLCNSGDLRAFHAIDTTYEKLIHHAQANEEEPNHFMLEFLIRRRAYMLIEIGELDKAESFLKRFLDKFDSSSTTYTFILQELQYVVDLKEKLRESNSEKE